jgi:hypothetical protein
VYEKNGDYMHASMNISTEQDIGAFRYANKIEHM